MSKSFCFYVQYLLGTGHLYRTLYLANHCAEQGHQVHLISGGKPLKHLSLHDKVAFHQLPAIEAADEFFSDYLDENGNSVIEEWWQKRIELFLSLLQSIQIDAFITETYPFGRRLFRKELFPAFDYLQSLKPTPKIISSIRDILNPKPPHKDKSAEVLELIEKYFDLVLVHSDESLIKLGETFPKANAIESKLFYTGYIHHQSTNIEAENTDKKQILVSAGGGRVGHYILDQAYQAALIFSQKHPDYHWLFITGQNALEKNFQETNTIRFVGHVPSLSQTMRESEISISQCGYNTVCDVLETGCKALFIPFENESEKEQALRAQLLQKQLEIPCLLQDTVTPATILDQIEMLLKKPKPTYHIRLDGIEKTLAILEKHVGMESS